LVAVAEVAAAVAAVAEVAAVLVAVVEVATVVAAAGNSSLKSYIPLVCFFK
jgi:hypothetical protein